MPDRLTVGLAANTIWNTANFRFGLVEALHRSGHRVVCIAPDEDFWPEQNAIEKLESAGAEYVELNMDRGGTNPIADLFLLVRMLRVYRRLRPDIMLHYTVKPVVYGSIAARLLRIPNVAVVTGQGSALLGKRSPVAAITRGLLRFALRHATGVFFLNPADRADFIARGMVLESRSRVLPGEGVDTELFAPSGPMPDTPTFLMVARLLRDKGVYEYVAAARRLRQAHPEARFLLGGALDTANPSAVEEAELAAWRAEGDIEYLGVVDDPRPWYRRASAVVLPSYREGMSRVLLEAISCGRPVLASDVPGCRELVTDGFSGYVFPPRDAQALGDAMERFMQLSHEEQVAFGRHGRKRALAEFDDVIVNQIYLDMLPALREGRFPGGY
jgi:glycosyltransferase involved in cell wall biosynthesis